MEPFSPLAVLLAAAVLLWCPASAASNTIEVRAVRGVWSFGAPAAVGVQRAEAAVVRATVPAGVADAGAEGAVRMRCGTRLVESCGPPGRRMYASAAAMAEGEARPLLAAAGGRARGGGEFVAFMPREALPASLAECSIRFLPPDERLACASNDTAGAAATWPRGWLPLAPEAGGRREAEAAGPMAASVWTGVRDAMLRAASDDQPGRERRRADEALPPVLRPARSNPRLMSLVEESADLAVGFTGIIKGIAASPMKGVADPMSEAVSSAVGPGISSTVTPAITTVVSDQIGNQIGPALINPINEELPMGLAETVSETLTADLSRVVANDFTTNTYHQLTSAVNAGASAATAANVAQSVEHTAPPVESGDLVSELGSLVTHAASRALVSSLGEVLTHSTEQDYYGWACWYHKLYCPYVQNGNSRGYYSNYYASYYAAWFTPHFAQFFSSPGHQHWVGDKYPDTVLPPADKWVPLPSPPGSRHKGNPEHGAPPVGVIY